MDRYTVKIQFKSYDYYGGTIHPQPWVETCKDKTEVAKAVAMCDKSVDYIIVVDNAIGKEIQRIKQ